MSKNNITYYFLFLCLLSVVTNGWADDRYQVVAHPASSNEIISVNSLRAIFSMRINTWPDGKRIKVYVLPDDNPLHQRFSKERLNVFPYQLRSAWDRLVFSGTGQAPNVVSTSDEMLAKISSTPGAIGYLYSIQIDDNVNVLQIK